MVNLQPTTVKKQAKFRWQKDGAPEPALSPDQVDRIIGLAKEAGPREYFLFSFLGVRGWRIGTIVGHHKVHRYMTRRGEARTVTVDLPGIRKEDVQEDSIVIHAKGGLVRKDRVPEALLREAQEYARTLQPDQRLVELEEYQALKLCKEYAARGGLENPEYYYPHLFRHAFGSYWARKTGRDPWKVRDLMGHKTLQATNRYVSTLSLEEQKELLG